MDSQKRLKSIWTNVICVMSLCRTDENLATGLCKVSRWWLAPRYAMIHRWTCMDLRWQPTNHHGKHYQNLHCMRTLKLNLIRTLTVLRSSNWSIRFVMLRDANHSSSDYGSHCFTTWQMHGYDLPPGPQGPPPPRTGPMSEMLNHHHPDSTDSYVTYQDSDDSMQGSP